MPERTNDRFFDGGHTQLDAMNHPAEPIPGIPPLRDDMFGNQVPAASPLEGAVREILAVLSKPTVIESNDKKMTIICAQAGDGQRLWSALGVMARIALAGR
jgi:hypothetical protein